MNAWIFDVDGVLTDPTTKKPDEKVLKRVANLLRGGQFVALNTGRSFSWTHDSLLSKLSQYILDENHFENFFIVCEKGNVLANFEKGKWVKKVLDDSLPKPLLDEIAEITNKEYSESMFIDTSKETMISVEMKDGFDTETYSDRQKSLYPKIESILVKKYREMELIIDPSQISLDIQYEDAGKHLGAERIEDFMMEHGVKPEKVFMFGDSSSDVQMATELEGSYQVIFIFVNEKAKLKNTPMCEVVYTKEKFTKGTLEFLDNSSDVPKR